MELVWKALGDSTRRQMLDLLKDQPLTTGALAEQFAQSRYGVMKHLSVLEAAGLVLVRRQGRQRFNHLNAVPLREIYERWLGPYQEFWSSSLLRLKDHVEQEPIDLKQEQTMNDFHSFHIEQEVKLAAPKDKVWAALTSDIGKWWAFHLGEEGSVIQLEARVGGLFEERWGDGEGIVWGQVVRLQKGKQLRIKGSCGMTGAASSDFCYELEGEGHETLLKLTHHAFGYRDPETAQNFKGGWETLLTKYLSAWVESAKTYQELPSEAKSDA